MRLPLNIWDGVSGSSSLSLLTYVNGLLLTVAWHSATAVQNSSLFKVLYCKDTTKLDLIVEMSLSK